MCDLQAHVDHVLGVYRRQERTLIGFLDFLENFFHLLPYWYFINRAFGIPGVGAGNISEDLSNNTLPLLEAFDAQRLNSFLLLQSLKQQQLQVQVS